MSLLFSVAIWIALGLPPACAYLAISHARESHTTAGRRRVWLWFCITILMLCALYLGITGTRIAFGATDCTVGTTLLGCTTTDASWGRALFDALWRLTLFTPVVLILSVLMLAFAGFRMWRNAD